MLQERQKEPKPMDIQTMETMPMQQEPSFQHQPQQSTPPDSRRGSKEQPKESKSSYKGESEDLLDQHVAYFMRKHPEVRKKHNIQRKRAGVYQLDGREVEIEWQYASEPGGQGFLVVVDGPLRQPFKDYMMDTEANAQYEGQDIGKSNLHMISRDRRISFNDTHKVYSRLEAMKVAKEQALVREKAATYVKDGRDVPQHELMQRYKKNIQIKLGQHKPKGQRPKKEEEQPPEAAAAPAPAMPQAPPAMPQAPPAMPQAPPTPAAASSPPPVMQQQPQVPTPPSAIPAAASPQAAGMQSPMPEHRQVTAPGASSPAAGQLTQPQHAQPQLTPPQWFSPPQLMPAGGAAGSQPSPFQTQLPGAWNRSPTPSRMPSGAGNVSIGTSVTLPPAPPLPGTAVPVWQGSSTMPPYAQMPAMVR